MYVSQTKREQLLEFMKREGVSDADIEERFVLGSGRGGQKLNKTASCVQLLHRPSGIIIKVQRTRSRELNRYYARKELCERLEETRLGKLSRRRQAIEKVRRQKRRRSRRQKERMLELKHRQSEKKVLRRAVRELD
jgi:protein subunit release factor B